MRSNDGDDAKKGRSDALSAAARRAEQAVLQNAGAARQNKGSGIKILPLKADRPAPKSQTRQIPVTTKAPASVDFGMVDLGGGGDAETPVVSETHKPAEEIQQVTQPPAAPDAPVADSTPTATDQPPQASDMPGSAGPSAHLKDYDHKPVRREKSRYKPVTVSRPRRSYKRQIKIAAIVLAIVALVGGAAFGIAKWRASSEAQRLAEQKRMNLRSLDSIKDQALRNNEGMK
ncbi:MAG TPA: hypothetical protein VM425_18030 [Myxococcota bacterium]|nr:hypothetical protein [Myxococcota bacterium]